MAKNQNILYNLKNRSKFNLHVLQTDRVIFLKMDQMMYKPNMYLYQLINWS
jgi:hypothetical protein